MARTDILKTAAAGLSAVLIAAAGTACDNDPYKTGDGSLSYMRADFVEASTDGTASVTAATTDNGTQLRLSPPLKASWITAKDSVYRALLYYNTNDEASADGGKATVEPVAISDVIVPKVVSATSIIKTFPTDPVTFDAAWLSKNNRYANISFYIKTGKKDGKTEAQSVGIAYTGTTTLADGTKCHRLALIHAQNDVPQYYSYLVYMSIPLYRLPFSLNSGDSIEIGINTYNGKTTKNFKILKTQ